MITVQPETIKPGLTDPDLNISELGDLHVSRPALRQQEEPALGHGDLPHAVAGLHRWRELVDTFVRLQVLQHDDRQIHVLSRRFSLLPEVVEEAEHLWIHLLLLTCVEEGSQTWMFYCRSWAFNLLGAMEAPASTYAKKIKSLYIVIDKNPIYTVIIIYLL